MGLLASGAAHELGTPLSIMSVIVGDWRHMPLLTRSKELQADIAELDSQIRRCKSIVSGILLSAGEARGESSEQTTVKDFLDDLAEEWRTTRQIGEFVYDNQFTPDLPVVSDSTLKQTINNLLDNALEASPAWVCMKAVRESDSLVVTVTDRGPGFPEAMLPNIGKPYQSTKGRPGAGLGLFLVVNVTRTLGGKVKVDNRPEGGAAVKLTLPLSVIELGEQR
jgi:two-component system sensor histidine kinase RegB